MVSEQKRPSPALPEVGEAHVWRIPLGAASARVLRDRDLLSAEERVRLDRHATPGAARQFAVTRTALRDILERYTGEPAAAVQLVVHESGKPGLAVDRGLHFSLTHTAALALVALARVEIGVDVERVRTPRRLLATARRVLHAETTAVLERLGGNRRQVAFLDAWTQREAHVKATGGGLFITRDVLPFVAEDAADGVPHTRTDRTGALWTVAHFLPSDGTRAALVARGSIDRVRYFDWTIMDSARGGDV